jgi:hypothetical protein
MFPVRCEHVFALLCGIGLVAHVFVISRRYFAYETSTKVIIDLECPIEAPTLSFCVRYMDLMNNTMLQQEFNITVNETTPVFDKYYKQSGNLKVSDIFSKTPAGEEIVDNCMIRKSGQNRRVHRSTQGSDKCFDIFNVTKFYMQSFMCYRFMPATNTSVKFSTQELAHSYNYEYSIYAIRVREELAHADAVLVILNYGPYPYLSRSFGALRKTRFTENSDERPNEYFVQTKVTEISLQPPPYDTGCDPDFDQASRSECIIKGMQDLDRVPNTEIVTRPYDLPHVLYNDDDNQTFMQVADKIYETCYNRFQQKRCNYSIAATDLRMRADSRQSRSLRIRVMGPRSPNTHVISEPAFDLSDFLLYVSSCFGIWLGVSVNRFNPITLLGIWKETKSKKRVYQQRDEKEKMVERLIERKQTTPIRKSSKHIRSKNLPPVRESSNQQITSHIDQVQVIAGSEAQGQELV